MKILCLLISLTMALTFSATAHADCPAGDPNCAIKDDGAGTMFLGTGCPACTALEKANTRLDGTSRNFRGGSQKSNSSTGTPVDVEN